jgi:hypothetical protein
VELALIVAVGVGAGVATVTVTEYVVVPAALVSEIVKVFVDVTDTICEPDVATEPMPLLMDADVAPLEVHSSVTSPPPRASEEGVAVNVPVGFG